MTILLFRTFAIFNGNPSACRRAAFTVFDIFAQKKTKKYSQSQNNKTCVSITHIPYFWYCLFPVTIRIKTADSIVRSYICRIPQLPKKSTQFRQIRTFAHSLYIFSVQIDHCFFPVAGSKNHADPNRSARLWNFFAHLQNQSVNLPSKEKSTSIPSESTCNSGRSGETRTRGLLLPNMPKIGLNGCKSSYFILNHRHIYSKRFSLVLFHFG